MNAVILILALAPSAPADDAATADARAAYVMALSLAAVPEKAPARAKAGASACPCPDGCRCPGTTCVECGCQCGEQRRWTECYRPCCCGCQDELYPSYCRCGEGRAKGGTGTAQAAYGLYHAPVPTVYQALQQAAPQPYCPSCAGRR